VLADHRQGPFARLADRPGRLRLRLGEQALLLLERPAGLFDLVRQAEPEVVDEIAKRYGVGSSLQRLITALKGLTKS